MANQLRHQIEQISREKNINPDVVIAAIEDAILTASKKYYRNNEDLRSRFNEESGEIDVFAVRQVVEEIEDPDVEISLEEARQLIAEAEVGHEIEFPEADGHPRTNRRADGEAGDLPEGPRGRARQRPLPSNSGRVGEVINGIIKRQEMGDFIVDMGARRSPVAPQGAEPGRGLPVGRPCPCGDRARPQVRQGPADRGQPHRSRASHEAVRDGGSRDLRRHGRHQGLRCARPVSGRRSR